MTATITPEIPEDLTDRQKDVLRLVREGKTPTEVGKELDISSQGVHGHLNRLRKRGLIPDHDGTTKTVRPARGARNTASRPARGAITPADAFAEVRASIESQQAALEARGTELDSDIEELKKVIEQKRAEKRQVDKARGELSQFAGTLPEPS